jgi:hypothetical protein
MFNPKILEILKHNEAVNRFDPSGSPIMLKGGVRNRLHPLPSMDFQPDSLATGDDLYKQPVAGQRVVGGSMKSIGKSISRGLKKVGKVVAPIAKEVGQNVVMPVVKDFATKQGRKFLTQQLEKFAINDALPVAETAAPLLLAAAGRKRKSSKGGMCGGTISGGTISGGTISGGGRRQARATLVRKIMKEHSCSLPEASRYIKENGIDY